MGQSDSRINITNSKGNNGTSSSGPSGKINGDPQLDEHKKSEMCHP